MLTILEGLAIVWLVLVLAPVLFRGLILVAKSDAAPRPQRPPLTREEGRAMGRGMLVIIAACVLVLGVVYLGRVTYDHFHPQSASAECAAWAVQKYTADGEPIAGPVDPCEAR